MPDHAFEFGDACFVLVGLAVAGEGALGVLLVELAPLDDRVGMKLMLARRLRDRLPGFNLADDLELELFSELTPLEGHG